MRQLLALAASLSLFAIAVSAQEPPAKPPTPAPTTKLAEWPAVSEADRALIVATTQQFAKPETKVHEPAHKKLVSLGDAAAPIVMQQVNDRSHEVNKKLFAVLDELLQKQHGALMAREAKKPRIELRRYLTLRMCRFLDPELLPVLVELRKEKDELTSFYASLGVLALKQKEALPAVAAYAKTHWADIAPLVAEVLPAARSHDAGEWVFESITKAPVLDQMTGLRLLRYLMVKDQGPLLKSYLDSPDHAVKREAVNAARVLHGEAPLENLPVFQVIGHSQEWKKKL